MKHLQRALARVGPSDATVLIIGESGTGKELIAARLHESSPRARGRYLALNCGAVSPNLIESELFGHEKGSFTGASRQHAGYFERAHGGTLFLDEITEMPMDLQVRLLRVLESKCVSRVGSSESLPVNVRVIAATNRDPREAVRQRKLREDLLYRLQVVPIEVPPLRARTGDARLLANHFLAELNRSASMSKTFSEDALERIARHDWPGNVRELSNVVQRAFIMAEGRVITDPGILSLALGHAQSRAAHRSSRRRLARRRRATPHPAYGQSLPHAGRGRAQAGGQQQDAVQQAAFVRGSTPRRIRCQYPRIRPPTVPLPLNY